MRKENNFRKLVIFTIAALMCLSGLVFIPTTNAPTVKSQNGFEGTSWDEDFTTNSDWPDHKMHYPQLPDPNGWNVMATYPYVCADDWQCSETGWVKDLHFWGSWYNDLNGYIGGFWISIHADIPATPTEPSHPGTCLWHEFITDFTETMMEPSLQGWYNPYTGEYYPENHFDWYQYDIILPQNLWFMQEEGTIYWLDISAAPILPGRYWGWKSSEDHWNDDAFFGECFGQYEFLWYDELYEPGSGGGGPITNNFGGIIDPTGEMIDGWGTYYYDDPNNPYYYYGWYWYENTWWWNMWFYDHPFDPERYKTIDIDFYAIPYDGTEGWLDIVVDWSTDLYYYDNVDSNEIPPLPPLDLFDEFDWIGRDWIWSGPIDTSIFIPDLFYEIPWYNPEWVSIDVYGYNVIFDGSITHECVGYDSLDLSFVITGGPYEEPPVTEKTLVGCQYFDGNYYWISYSTQICFTATDDVSGVYVTVVEAWWDKNANGIEDLGETVLIPIFDNSPADTDPTFGVIAFCLDWVGHHDGYHEIRYWSVDNAGIVEDTHIEIDIVDNTPPTITKTHPDPCYYPINETSGIIKVGDRIILEAIDGGTPPWIVGLDAIYYGFWYNGIWYPRDPFDMYCGNWNITMYKDGRWWYTYTKPIRFHETCEHILEYWAKDKVCNTGPIFSQIYWVNDCQAEVWIDDNFGPHTTGCGHTHFHLKQMALDWLGPYGTAYVYDGTYAGDISIDDVPCCDNTGITQMGEYGCYPTTESAIITGTETIKVDDVKIKYLEYNPNTNGAIVVEPNIAGTFLRCNKFNKGCIANAIGVNAQGGSVVDARLNWWGRPDGPNGGIMDDGKTANGQGVQILGNVLVEPWLGVHAEIDEPVGSITIDAGTSIYFDATGSFAITYGECCQEPEELPIFYLWDFDDGYYSMEEKIGHVFDSPGTYHVSLRVHSYDSRLWGEFMYDWAYLTVTVVTPGAPLTANADGNDLGEYETIVDKEIQLFGLATGGTPPYAYSWDLGDGTKSTLQNPTHTYSKAGTFTLTLEVTDSVGATATDTTEVLVHETGELVVNIIVEKYTITNLETLFTATVYGGVQPYTYSWNFGDGTISIDPNPIHEYKEPGTYTVTLTVTDSDNHMVSDTATIIVKEGESDIKTAEIKQVNGGFRITATILAGTLDCDWNIKVTTNFMILGGEASGTIEANTEKTVKLPLTISFGKVEITVIADEVKKQYTGFALGPLFLNLQEI